MSGDGPELHDSSPVDVGNTVIPQELKEIADLLTDQGALPFRINAYRNAAKTLRETKQPVAELYAEEDLAGMLRLERLGRGENDYHHEPEQATSHLSRSS